MGRRIQIGNISKNGWEVVDLFKDEKTNRLQVKVRCTCGCGEEKSARSDAFDKFGLCKVRHAAKFPKKEHMPREEYKTRLIGCVFGNLRVIKFAGYNKNKSIVYECECLCGNKEPVYATYTELTAGKRDNCGCLTRQKMSVAKKKYNKYDLSGEYGIGWTSNTNKEFYFDLEDYDKIKDYCWLEHCSYRGNREDCYIEARGLDGDETSTVRLHRVVMGISDPQIKIDHIKHNTFDNRKSQLRAISNQKNTFNHVVHSNSTTGETGVNWDKEHQKWRARIFINGKGIHLGRFDSFEDAVAARKIAEDKYFGEYSYDNSMDNA